MNFFQNCNQLPPGLDDDGGAVVGGSGLPGHIGGPPPMIRGMRPHGMRQQGGLMVGTRMPAPGNVNRGQQGSYLMTRQWQT